MSKYGMVDTVEVFDKLPTFKAGEYVIAVDKLEDIGTSKHGRLFIAEFNILESKGTEANPKGTRAKVVIPLEGKYRESKYKDLKNMVAAIIGEPATSVKGSMIDPLVEAAQPAKGAKLKLKAVAREPGDEYPKLQFSAA
jgi:hypothetical protein